MSDSGQLTIRRATDDDLDEIIEVCGAALEWSGDDADARFFSWKHLDNPFGRSPMWVAVDAADATGAGDRIVGVRAMMRWDFVHPDGRRRHMARAVDTATLPSHQGQGIFSRLTKAAVEELTAEGYDAIFNTPNDKSRPGYLKMGWESVGRVPVTVRPRNPLTLVTMARSKVAAERWGIPTDVGLAPGEAFADADRLESVLASAPAATRWSTPLSAPYLRWRTSFEPLACRIELLGSELADGFVVFRLRRRGALRQLSILHIVRPASSRSIGRSIGRLMASTGADVAMASGGDIGPRNGLVPLPSTGPLLTWRVLSDPAVAEMGELHVPLGAIELF